MKQVIFNYYDTGDMISYADGLVHSVAGEPAIITCDGFLFWFKENKLHRVNGPAYFGPSGLIEYWLEGIKYSKDEWEEITHHDDEDDYHCDHSKRDINARFT